MDFEREIQAISMMRELGIAASDQVIIETLKRNQFDLERTASDLWSALDTTPNEQEMPPLLRHTTPEPECHSVGVLNSCAGAPPPTPKMAPAQLAPVIDLTAEDEDEELRKALNLSLGSADNGGKPPVFGPSERMDPGQNWAMVPVSQAPAQDGKKNDHDADLQRAMEASMNMTYQDDYTPMRAKLRGAECWVNYHEDLPPSDWAEPVAIIVSDTRQTYCAALLHALFAVPQLRDALKRMQFSSDTNHPGARMQQLFATLDYSQKSHAEVAPILSALNVPALERGENPENPTARLMKSVLHGMIQQEDRLAGDVNTGCREPDLGLMSSNALLECPIVIEPAQNDLYSCLDTFFESNLLVGGALSSNTDIIVVRMSRDNVAHGPMELPLTAAVAAALNPTAQSSVGEQKEPLRYPDVLQMDRWFAENQQAVAERRNQLKELRASTRDLLRQLEVLSGPRDKPNLPTLRSTLHYIENVASTETEERKQKHMVAAEKLRSIIARLERQIQESRDAIQAEVEREKQFLPPDSDDTKYPFRLRSVLVHDGQYTSRSIYSYVRAPNGKWWKILLDEVVEVSQEAVLNDRMGLYLNAGPYILVYSKDYSTPNSTSDASSPVPGIIATHSWPLACLKFVAYDNLQFRESYLQENMASWLHQYTPADFEVLDPLTRDAQISGSPQSPELSPVLSSPGEDAGMETGMETTPITSPETAMSDADMAGV